MKTLLTLLLISGCSIAFGQTKSFNTPYVTSRAIILNPPNGKIVPGEATGDHSVSKWISTEAINMHTPDSSVIVWDKKGNEVAWRKNGKWTFTNDTTTIESLFKILLKTVK